MKSIQWPALALLLSLVGPRLPAAPFDPAFTYHGRLTDAAQPANGVFEFEFGLWTDASRGTLLETRAKTAIDVANGLFAVELDFNPRWIDGDERWLEIKARRLGAASYTTLSPRQRLAPTPHALHAREAGLALTVADGSITASHLAAGAVTAASLAGNSITADKLAPGAVGTAQLAANSVTADKLAPGAGVGAGLPPTSVVLSEFEVNPNLLNAGFVPTGVYSSNVPPVWTGISDGPPATGILGFPRYGHSAVWVASLAEMFIVGGEPVSTGLRYRSALNTWSTMSTPNGISLDGQLFAAWTGTRLLVWNSWMRSGGLYNPANNTWQVMSTTGAPSSRSGDVAVWTGTRLIVWGGYGGGVAGISALSDGRIYNPATDTWAPMSVLPPEFRRAQASAVWTGSEMVIVGGYYETTLFSLPTYLSEGLRYQLATDSWTVIPTPAGAHRRAAQAVWTGTEMILMGGEQPGGPPSAWRYNPTTGAWTQTANHAVLNNLNGANVAWTGTHVLLWGGASNPNGARYTPAADTWTVLPAPGADARVDSSAVWTGTDLLGWGGRFVSSGDETDDGRRYNLAANAWSALSVPPGTGETSERTDAVAVWAGDRLVVWGGANLAARFRTGGIYRPGVGWTSTPTIGAPSARAGHTAVWTGTEMIVWGGDSANGFTVNTGARFHVGSNRWFSMNLSNAPSGRRNHSAVWTGTEMIVWGGYQRTNLLDQDFLRTGASYNPATDQWNTNVPVHPAFSGRARHTAVWTGTEMILWGGYSRSGPVLSPTYNYYGNGVRYTPGSNAMSLLPFAPAGNARTDHTAVWTGREMILWGGYTSTGDTNTGLRFNPDLNSWTTMAAPGPAATFARSRPGAVWTGQFMIVHGGEKDGVPVAGTGLFDPLADKWYFAPSSPVSVARTDHVAVWTGTQMLVGDGRDASGPIASWGSLTPHRAFYYYVKP